MLSQVEARISYITSENDVRHVKLNYKIFALILAGLWKRSGSSLIKKVSFPNLFHELRDTQIYLSHSCSLDFAIFLTKKRCAGWVNIPRSSSDPTVVIMTTVPRRVGHSRLSQLMAPLCRHFQVTKDI